MNLEESAQNTKKVKKINKKSEQMKIRNLSGRTELISNQRKLYELANTIQPDSAASKIQNEI